MILYSMHIAHHSFSTSPNNNSILPPDHLVYAITDQRKKHQSIRREKQFM